ncbi:MAG: sulfite reductase [Chlamydiia bacterium]|nr:sulfite reductase [Chlamydiia bacterium]
MTTVYTKDHLFLARLKDRYVLNKPGSSKQTYHVTLDIEGSDIHHVPGDTLAVMPSNHPEQVNQLLALFDYKPSSPIIDPRSKKLLTLDAFLSTKVNLNRVPKKLLEHLNIEGDFPDLTSCLKAAGPYQGSLEKFCTLCAPMLPRFYSIASSITHHPSYIDLVISTFKHIIGDREIPGVGSDFLCHQVDTATPIPVYHQATKHFLLPENPHTPIIMIGPGTGVAPYRAFLQERQDGPGKNWLIFGERNRAFDFYYEEFFQELQDQGKLHLDTAFSRDQEDKCYVQHKLQLQKTKLWEWLEDGAVIYICGDAKRMAKDVLHTLESIIVENCDNPGDYIKALRKEKRLLLDVY